MRGEDVSNFMEEVGYHLLESARYQGRMDQIDGEIEELEETRDSLMISYRGSIGEVLRGLQRWMPEGEEIPLLRVVETGPGDIMYREVLTPEGIKIEDVGRPDRFGPGDEDRKVETSLDRVRSYRWEKDPGESILSVEEYLEGPVDLRRLGESTFWGVGWEEPPIDKRDTRIYEGS